MRSFGTGRHLALFLTLLLACHEASPTVTTPFKPGRRRALLIGIDDYSASKLRKSKGVVSDRWIPQLRGAVRDVESMQQLLVTRYRFQPGDILVLKNQDARRDTILRKIEEHLIQPSVEGDVLLFYYAGHGSQAPNSLSNEQDKQDETIVPADSAAGAADITDKKLAELFNRILDKKAHLTVVLDSCHSGSGARDWPGLPSDRTVRAAGPTTQDVHDASNPTPPEQRGALVLSGSADFGRSFEAEESDHQYHGVFSWALLQAMRAAPLGESAEDTFLRAQAAMRSDTPFQNPIITGSPAAQLTPFFGESPAESPFAPTIALEEIRTDGTVVVQGGWAHGLTEGTELRLREGDADLRIRIDSITGVARSEGRIVRRGPATRHSAIGGGTLLEIAAWAAPPSRPMRVWMPQVDDTEPARVFAERLKKAAAGTTVEWVDDPIATVPTHVLRWHDRAWELCSPDNKSDPLTLGLDPETVLSQLPPKSALFVQLPAPAALIREIDVGAGSDNNSVERTRGPAEADYTLAGRLSPAGIEYSWIRPAVHKNEINLTPMPPRSEWQSPTPLRDASVILRQAILRLHKILAWHLIPSPPDGASPYRLELVSGDNTEVTNARVDGLKRYSLVLQAIADPLPPILQPRYYYVFGIDAFGKSVLLFPLHGSVENRFPIAPDGTNPLRQIGIGSVTIRPPYGVDSYFLISTDESIPNPQILAWSGVRRRGPKGATGLEELLSRAGGSSRSPDPNMTSSKWSIDHMVIESIPPQ